MIYNQRAANCNRQLSMEQSFGKARGMAHTALWLLLAINLFNYIDRYILAAVLPQIKHDFLAGDPNQNAKAGSVGASIPDQLHVRRADSWMAGRPYFAMVAGWNQRGHLEFGERMVGVGRFVRDSTLDANVRRNW